MFVCSCVSLDNFGFVFYKVVLLSLVFSVPSQEISWEEQLQNDLYCVECRTLLHFRNKCNLDLSRN